MSRKRKTIQINNVKKRANDFLLNSQDFQKEERLIMGTFLESILMDTNNYNGFRPLYPHDMENSKEGTTYGINVDENGEMLEMPERFEGVDYSRVEYY